MKTDVILRQLLIWVAAAGIFACVEAQQLTLGVNAGISQPIGEEYDEWKTGFNIGGHGFIWPMERIGFGVRVGYNRWGIDEDGFVDQVENITDVDVDGSTTIIEIIPSARIRTAYDASPINFFGQLGFGLYVIGSESELTGTVLGEPTSITFDDDWIGRWGIQIGPGVSLGSSERFSIDVFPLYNLVFDGDEVFQYFIANAGVSLKF